MEFGPEPDLRALLADAIAARHPVDDRESVSIAAFQHGLATLADPCSEEADPTHVTASAIVVGPQGVLLHRHKRLGIWLQPGGHIDPGELPWDAAVREAQEETGLVAVHAAGAPYLVHVDVHPGPRGHTHLDLRYLLVAEGDPDPGEGESPDVAWFAWEEAIAMTDPGLSGALAALAPGAASIRRASPEDAPALAELYLRSRRHALPTVTSAHSDDETRAWVASTLLIEHEVWVAEAAGARVGILALGADTIEQLYLEPAWIGGGIGSRLVDVAKRLRPHGLQLWTFQVNESARRFYARHGFVEAELTDGTANEEIEPDVRLVWRSPPR